MVVAACAMQGCSSDSPDVKPAGDQEMKFVTSNDTRSAVSNIAYAGSSFALFGDMKFADNNPTVVFNNKAVTYNGNVWTYEGAQYWMPGHEHSFVAVYPAKVFENGAPQYANSKLSFTYTLPTLEGGILDKDGTSDLMASTHRRRYSDGFSTTVSLTFAHLMSLVNIAPAFNDNLMSDDAYLLLHKIELTGVNTAADFEILPAALLSGSQTDDLQFEVTAKDPGNLAIEFSEPVKMINKAGSVSLFPRENPMLMLPQAFAADSEAKIVFYYSTSEDPSTRDIDMPLSTYRWESGKSYTYKITIERSGLNVENCEITPWNNIYGDEITVD